MLYMKNECLFYKYKVSVFTVHPGHYVDIEAIEWLAVAGGGEGDAASRASTLTRLLQPLKKPEQVAYSTSPVA